MNKKIIAFFSFLLLHLMTFKAYAAIGDWKAYMAYHDIQEIEQAANLIFVQASNNLYVYNQNDQSIQTFSKMDYLSDCDIQHIAYNKAAKRLLIIYSNSNIDLMNINNYETDNLSDYYNANTTGSKAVNSIYMNGKFAYMCNGFGIVKINVANKEISETYNLGFNVNWCEIKDNYIYAYSQTNGAYRAPLTVNLLDKNNWNFFGGYVAKTEEDKSELKQLVSTLNPGGPKYNYFGYLKFANNQLYTCGGNVGGLRNACIQILDNNNWNIYKDENISNTTGVSYQDIVCLDYNPLDTKQVFAGGRNGLYEFYDGKFVNFYNKENSIIEAYNNKSKEYELVQGVKFDSSGNLWLLNSQAPTQSIIEYSVDKKWISHSKPELMKLDDNINNIKNKSLGSLENMMIDSRGLLWFVNNHWQLPSFYCYQFSNDALKAFTSFTNQDGTNILPSSIKTVVEDNNHDLWIGSDQGPFLLESNQITSESPIFTQVKVPRNDGTNYADYLLSGVNILSIAIDKANRKWFGTSGSGVYLISSDNIQQLQHFTTSNSPLLSDDVESIAINDATGEVFFGTTNGLCSYQSDTFAINDNVNKDNVWAYPNPTKPNYTGYINIVGFSLNADVKIVSSNGTLVNQGQNTSGVYRWNGRDLNGKKVASGIYMAISATQEGEKEVVCKIAIIN